MIVEQVTCELKMKMENFLSNNVLDLVQSILFYRTKHIFVM